MAGGAAQDGAGSRLALNVDDPAIAGLADAPGLKAKAFTFGIEDTSYALGDLPHAAELDFVSAMQ